MAMGPDDFPKTDVDAENPAPPADKVFTDGADIPGETHKDEIARTDAVQNETDGDSNDK